MFVWRHQLPVVLVCAMVFMGWVGNAMAHRRVGLPLVHPVTPSAPQATNPQVEKADGLLSLKPDSYWQRLMVQEQGGEFEEGCKSGMTLVNLFPQAPQRGVALLRLAEMAKGKGEIALALELYSLAACLVPGTPEAAQACLEARVLEFSMNLSHGDPIQALQHFLEQVATVPSGYAPETLQKALSNGWQAVYQKIQATSPPPLSLVEKILALWDMQPQGSETPEVAGLLADLLKKYGLMEEAQNLLAQAGEKTKGDRKSNLQMNNLKLPRLSKGFPGIADFLKQVPGGKEKQKFFLHKWLNREQPSVEFSSFPLENLLAWFLPQQANAWWDGQLPSLDQSLKQPWGAPVEEHLQASLAQSISAKSHLSDATQMSQQMADKPLRSDLSPFNYDRLGLNHLKEGETDAAQKTFQELAQHNDPFWRRLAQVRLTDVELSRLQAEPSP